LIATLAARAVVAFAVALATFGVAATAAGLLHLALPDWLLPVATLAGLLVAARVVLPAPGAAAHAAARGRLARAGWIAALLLGALAVATVAHGALATPSRNWDGAVMWDLKAAALTAAPTVEQPLFRDADVYCHSRDYPLLQPLVVAALERCALPGRALFPLALAALLAAVAAGARVAREPAAAPWCTAAVALTPMVMAPTSGGFDSGYADGPLAALAAASALGVVLGAPVLIAAGTIAMALWKPEGCAYAATLVAATWLHGDRRAFAGAVLGAAVGGALALAQQHDLATCGAVTPVWPVLAAVAGAGVALAGDAVLRARGAARGARGLAVAAATLLAAAVLPWLVPPNGSLGCHVADGARASARLARLPRIAAALAEWAWLQGRFALAFVLPLLLRASLRARSTAPAAPALGTWLVLAVPVLALPFVLSPLDDVEHHLRSSLPRLLSHWIGAAWLWCAVQPWSHATPTAGIGQSATRC
jgi:hypothetical protein